VEREGGLAHRTLVYTHNRTCPPRSVDRPAHSGG
jgi:hypothetical protein